MPLAAALAMFAVACGSEPIAPGQYALSNDDVRAILTVTSSHPLTFSLQVVGRTDDKFDRELDDVQARDVGDTRLMVRGEPDCAIVLTSVGEGLDLSQDGACAEMGGAWFLGGYGHYARK